MANLVYNQNQKLKAVGVEIPFTQEQVQEYYKCSQDPVYFITNYAKIVSLDDGIVPFIPYPYQERIINAVHNNNNIIAKIGRQLGKCVDGSTAINIRNKKTGEIISLSIGEFYELIKNQEVPDLS